MANIKRFCKTIVKSCPYCKTGTYKKPERRKKRRELKNQLRKESKE
jgi:hypothetical protein